MYNLLSLIMVLLLVSFHRGFYVFLSSKMKTNYFFVKIFLSGILSYLACIFLIVVLVGSLVAMYVRNTEMLLVIFYFVTISSVKLYLKYMFFAMLICGLVSLKSFKEKRNMNESDKQG